MVARPNRIPRHLFPTYFASGKRFHSTHFTIIATNTKDFKVSTVVSKKVAKSAVDRNRLRRRAYGVMERQYQQEQLAGTYIILYKPGALRSQRLVLQNELETLLAQIKKAR